ncbi:hypothetical protein [Shigella boydii]|nr:hypothetical protein [Shigella boydii]MDS1443783.1 hypothetical protein [Shigella boydii]MDS1449307.1 hypothetical protein [Shigella boydii]MDS1482634.1 hypothetical protein [Shigella boydii]MDS1485168.1 hypothetical protein [Shigella boydii]
MDWQKCSGIKRSYLCQKQNLYQPVLHSKMHYVLLTPKEMKV